MTAVKIDISLCPTWLEYNSGDTYDTTALLDAMREFIEDRHPNAKISLQIGHRQGDAWSLVDGDPDAGSDLVEAFFADHGTDEELFVETEDKMTLQDFVNANPYTMVFVSGVGNPTGQTEPAGHPDMDWVDRIGVLDLEGQVDKEGWWQWDGEGDPLDERGNSILKVTAYVSQSEWEKAVANWEAEV